jgi:hypothetical protein
VYGPQIVGNAATSVAPSWFMDCLHLGEETYDNVATPLQPNATGEKVTKKVAWFIKHQDAETGVPYLCKARCLPEDYERLLSYFPYGFIPLGFNQGVEVYFKVIAKLRKERENK